MEKDKLKYQNFIIDDTKYQTLLSPKFVKRKPYSLNNPAIVKAFLPGKIISITVKKGQKIKKGDTLCSFDAMKMENFITSQVNAIVKQIHISVGTVVAKNDLLFELEPLDTEQ